MYYNSYQPPTNNGIIWVQGEAGAKSYLVAPNSTVQLWDSESQTVYLKSADASGMPSMKILDYTIRPDTSQKTLTEPHSEFATKDDIDSIWKAIESLKGDFKKEEKKK